MISGTSRLSIQEIRSHAEPTSREPRRDTQQKPAKAGASVGQAESVY